MTKKAKKKVTIDDLINLDIRKEGNEKRLLKGLARTKWLKKFDVEDINQNLLEKLYRKVTKKYPAQIGYIHNAGGSSWAFMIKRTDNGKWIYTIYAKTLLEGLAKTILVLYGYFIKEMPFHDVSKEGK